MTRVPTSAPIFTHPCSAWQSAIPAPLAFDPERAVAPALHNEIQLPRIITFSTNSYVRGRDSAYLARPHGVNADPVHRTALKDFGVYTLPGWGNFAFGAEYSDYAHNAAGRGLHHISVAKDGRIAERGRHTLIGSPRTALAAEWTHEFPTVVYRTWYARRLKEHSAGTPPERELFLGHSKGGLLVYLLACLARHYRAGTLDVFAAELKDASGRPVLAGVPRKILADVGRELQDAVFGALGSPLYGINPEFASIADLGVGHFSFNGLTGNSAAYYAPHYLSAVHLAAGFKPHEVMDFVVTSALAPLPSGVIGPLGNGARLLGGAVTSPFRTGRQLLFNGLSRFAKPDLRHDGVAPADYPEPFEHHLRLTDVTHTDQVEDPQVLRAILDFLIARGVLNGR